MLCRLYCKQIYYFGPVKSCAPVASARSDTVPGHDPLVHGRLTLFRSQLLSLPNAILNSNITHLSKISPSTLTSSFTILPNSALLSRNTFLIQAVYFFLTCQYQCHFLFKAHKHSLRDPSQNPLG